MEPRDLEPVYGRGPTILLWSAAILCTVCFLGARGLWGAEDRWAEIAREMRLTGDYFHPRLNGEAYFDKPLLTYWLILPAAAIAGRLDEAVARAPSVVAGLIALGATMSLARRLGTARQGRTAGWILLSMLGFLFWARTAEADMENLAAIILAVAWYWARRDKPGFVSYVVFYVICFVGSQTKGMAAIALPILLVLPDVLKGQRWRSYLSVSHALAILVGLAVYVMPLVYAETTRTGYQQSGLYMAFKENIVRYFRPFDHKEPFYVYLGYVPELVFPWTPLFVAAVWTAITTFRRCDWPGQWLSLSILLVFLFFTLSGSRRSYYILPILPFVAIQISRFFDGAGDDKWTRLAFAVQAWLLGAVAIFEILSVAIWPLLKNRIGFVASRDLVLVTPILGLLAILSLALGRGRPLLQSRIAGVGTSFGSLVVASVVLVGGFFVFQEHMLNPMGTLKSFSLDLKERVDGLTPADITFFGQCPGDTVFYLGLTKPIRCLGDTDDVREFLSTDGANRVLISRSRFLKELEKAFPEGDMAEPTLKEKIYPWEKEKDPFMAWIIPDRET